MGLINDISELEEKKLKLIEKLKNLILTLPENEEPSFLGKNIFTIKFSQLSNRSWSPKFYHFRHQYKAISNRLSNTPVSKLEFEINKISRTKKVYTHNSWKKEYLQLHDKVIEYLENKIKPLI